MFATTRLARLALAAATIALVTGCATSVPLDDSQSSGGSGGATKLSVSGDTDAAKDVKLAQCALLDPYDLGDQYASPGAVVSITNSGDKARSYFVTITFESNDGATQYGTGIVSTSNLAGGQTFKDTAMLLEKTDAADFVCKVSEVSVL